MTIKYSYSVVTLDAEAVKELQLDLDPILMMKYVKDFLNERLTKSKLKTLGDLRVVDVRSVYNPIERKFYFYITSSYSIQGEQDNE